MYSKMIKLNQKKIINGRSYKEIIKRFESKINDPRKSEMEKKGKNN